MTSNSLKQTEAGFELMIFLLHLPTVRIISICHRAQLSQFIFKRSMKFEYAGLEFRFNFKQQMKIGFNYSVT